MYLRTRTLACASNAPLCGRVWPLHALTCARSLHTKSSPNQGTLNQPYSRHVRPRPQPTITRPTVRAYSTPALGAHLTPVSTSAGVAPSSVPHNVPPSGASAASDGVGGGVMGGLQRVLTPGQKILLDKVVLVIDAIRKDLKRADASAADIERVGKSLAQLEDLFLLVVVGEFNSGKSSFLNALLGKNFLTTGVTPTTSKINILKYGPTAKETAEDENTLTIQLPVGWLNDISLVDTPGTNAVIKGHQVITEHFVPRSDMVLFVTSVDRAFSESERIFLAHIKQWRKKIVVVVSKVDILDNAGAQLPEVVEFVQKNFRDLLGIDPIIFPVSSKKAARAKEECTSPAQLASSSGWGESQFGKLESYILQSLNGEERAKLKLINPVGVADNLLQQNLAALDAKLEVIKADLVTLNVVTTQLEAFRQGMIKDFGHQLSRVENCLLKMGERAESFFDDKLQLSNTFGLLKVDQLKLDFERQVLSDTSRDIDRHVSDIIDWMVEKSFKEWRHIYEYLNTRPSLRSDQIVGTVRGGGDFLLNRGALLDSIGASASEAVNSYDRTKETAKLTEQMRSALLQTAAVEVGALGIGAILTATILDFTGIIGAGVVAALGLGILPYKRATIKRNMRQEITLLREKLNRSLDSHFTRELENSVTRIRDNISPYANFVRSENDRMHSTRSRLISHTQSLKDLREEIERVFSSTNQTTRL